MGLSLSRILAVLAKEFTQLVRDRLTYAMILGVPVFQLLLFGYAINTDPKHLPTAVLVQDQGDFSRSVLGSHRATATISTLSRQSARPRARPADRDAARSSSRSPFPATSPGEVVRGENAADPGRGRCLRSRGDRRRRLGARRASATMR